MKTYKFGKMSHKDFLKRKKRNQISRNSRRTNR